MLKTCPVRVSSMSTIVYQKKKDNDIFNQCSIQYMSHSIQKKVTKMTK